MQTSCDSLHRTGRLVKSDIIPGKDPETAILMRDRQFIGNMADRKHQYITIPSGSMDIITFLKTKKMKYQDWINDIILFTKNHMLLKRTYEIANRDKILNKLQTLGLTKTKYIIKLIKYGYLKVIPQHYPYMLSYFFGWQTFEQLTETNIIDKEHGQAIWTEEGIKMIDVPRYPLPASFVLYLAQCVGISTEICNVQLMSRCGYHHLDILIGALDSYYKLTCNL